MREDLELRFAPKEAAILLHHAAAIAGRRDADSSLPCGRLE